MPWIHRTAWIGVSADLASALADANAPTTNDGIALNASDFAHVSAEEYDHTVLDLRYENGEWQQ